MENSGNWQFAKSPSGVALRDVWPVNSHKMVAKWGCIGWCMELYYGVHLLMCVQWSKRQVPTCPSTLKLHYEILKRSMQGQPQFRDMAKETDPLEPILEDLYEPDHDPPAAVSGYEYEPSEFAPEEMPAEVPGIVTVMMPGMREEREKELQGETEDSDVSTELPMPLEHPDRPPHPLHHPRPELPADASPRKRARAALETAAATPVPEQAEGHELAVDDVRFVDMVKGSLPHGWTVVENAFELDEAWLASATTNHLRRGRGEINAGELNVSDREKVIQAKMKELESFFTNKVWKFIDPKANQISKDRTVTTRWVLTWKPGVPDKNGHVSGPRAKARLVLRGLTCFPLRRTAPLPSELAR